MTIFLSSRNPCAGLLTAAGRPVRLLPPWRGLPGPVRDHPDLLTAPFGDGVLTTPGYAAEHPELFDGISVALTAEELSPVYPGDVLLDVLTVDDTALGHPACAKALRDSAKFLPVRQGYARCSVLLAGDAAVTADAGLSRVLASLGLDVLTIPPGGILLPGYDAGFIGGASLTVGDTVWFFGDVGAFPSGSAVCAHLRKHGFSVADCPGVPLTDFGGGTVTGCARN